MNAIPISMIFKYFLFFDIFEGGKIPNEIKNKLLQILSKDANLYSDYITKNEYDILKKKYVDTKSKNDSKSHLIVEFKRDLLIKYFSENAAIKLGFKQKDIFNEKIDKIMPPEFTKSHQNLIKHFILGQQKMMGYSKNAFFFEIRALFREKTLFLQMIDNHNSHGRTHSISFCNTSYRHRILLRRSESLPAEPKTT